MLHHQACGRLAMQHTCVQRLLRICIRTGILYCATARNCSWGPCMSRLPVKGHNALGKQCRHLVCKPGMQSGNFTLSLGRRSDLSGLLQDIWLEQFVFTMVHDAR